MLELDLVDRAAVTLLELGLGLEVGAAGAVVALVAPRVDVAVVVNPLNDLGDLRHVLGVGGADEEVVGDVQPGRELLEPDGVLVAQLTRRDAELLGGLGDRLTVLVGAREKEDVLPALAHVPREHVRRDRRIRVPKMRLAVDVVDGRGDVVRHAIDSTRAAAGRGWAFSLAISPGKTPNPAGAAAGGGCHRSCRAARRREGDRRMRQPSPGRSRRGKSPASSALPEAVRHPRAPGSARPRSRARRARSRRTGAL